MDNSLRWLDEGMEIIRDMRLRWPVSVYSDIGFSSEGYPIHAVKVGTSDRCLVSFAGIHGNEVSTSSGIMSTIISLLKDPSVVADVSYVGIPCLNPDGAKRNQRQNATGVDVNRDFGECEEGGTDFTSEEARAAREIMERFGPSYVLDHHDTPSRIRDDCNTIISYDFECAGDANDDGLKPKVEDRLNERMAAMGYVAFNSPYFRKALEKRCGQLVNFAAENYCSATIIEALGDTDELSSVYIHTITDLIVLDFLSE